MHLQCHIQWVHGSLTVISKVILSCKLWQYKNLFYFFYGYHEGIIFSTNVYKQVTWNLSIYGNGDNKSISVRRMNDSDFILTSYILYIYHNSGIGLLLIAFKILI